MRRNRPDTFLSFPNRVCLSIPLARKTLLFMVYELYINDVSAGNRPNLRNNGQRKSLKMTVGPADPNYARQPQLVRTRPIWRSQSASIQSDDDEFILLSVSSCVSFR
jgi:hypothetical protein